MGEALSRWTNPVLVLFSDQDPIFPVRAGQRFVDEIPGAGPLELVEGAGHFLQEDCGEELGRLVNDFIQRNP